MWKDRIVSDPGVLHGRVCIKGTRIPISVILDNLAEGASHTDIIGSYPSLKPEDIQAAIQYAAELTREQLVAL